MHRTQRIGAVFFDLCVPLRPNHRIDSGALTGHSQITPATVPLKTLPRSPQIISRVSCLSWALPPSSVFSFRVLRVFRGPPLRHPIPRARAPALQPILGATAPPPWVWAYRRSDSDFNTEDTESAEELLLEPQRPRCGDWLRGLVYTKDAKVAKYPD